MLLFSKQLAELSLHHKFCLSFYRWWFQRKSQRPFSSAALERKMVFPQSCSHLHRFTSCVQPCSWEKQQDNREKKEIMAMPSTLRNRGFVTRNTSFSLEALDASWSFDCLQPLQVPRMALSTDQSLQVKKNKSTIENLLPLVFLQVLTALLICWVLLLFFFFCGDGDSV